jgi:hypothetical protein
MKRHHREEGEEEWEGEGVQLVVRESERRKGEGENAPFSGDCIQKQKGERGNACRH